MKDEFYIRTYAFELLKIADEDYIAARALFKANFGESFLMLAQQCIEKYLKVILLYNLKLIKDIKNKGHDLEDLLERVSNLGYIDEFLIQLKKDKGDRFYNEVIIGVRSFNYAEHVKYGILSFSIRTESLLMLDRFVFIFRRFCKTPEKSNNLFKFKLFNCHLELVEKNKNSKYNEQYKYLIWKNFYWGKRKKPKIKVMPFFRFKNPVFFSTNNPKKYYEVLRHRIIMPDDLKKYLNSQ